MPPPPNADLAQFGNAMAVAILEADNKTTLFGGQTLQAVATAQKSPNITVASLEVGAGLLNGRAGKLRRTAAAVRPTAGILASTGVARPA